jgi:hypothetical protein
MISRPKSKADLVGGDPPSFVIPSEAKDLQFASVADTGKLQIPRFARDDKNVLEQKEGRADSGGRGALATC